MVLCLNSHPANSTIDVRKHFLFDLSATAPNPKKPGRVADVSQRDLNKVRGQRIHAYSFLRAMISQRSPAITRIRHGRQHFNT